MLVLLPPSETKRSGGDNSPLDLDALAFPSLFAQRAAVTDALVALSAEPDAAARVLKLSDRQRGEIADNAALRSSPTMPAIDRYTGVLFDAVDAATLTSAGRRWLGAHVMIHSAPFGPVGALDRLPTYRLAAGASLPGVAPLRRVWADAVSSALAHAAPPFVIDLRSEAYVALGPVPAGVPSVYVRVVTEEEGAAVRALNHFNKHAKGAFVRALAEGRPTVHTAAGLCRWAQARGWMLRGGRPGELDLVV
ncbi:YaaA family protein [Microbacterium memoriense]|uniref:Peroxide stress protein YaaA n=1 Tax=Microbacterium memoriense TaxID=2978350 RepID=A0ABT2PBN9_9MICO|nr:peroxide stress protein YaaA [Microbacterium memoriense]MCT9002029.1 peroxide stress protein YaaA [Microbacterium memoriense]